MTLPKKKKAAIIGGGWSGLMTIKVLKEESDFFEPICFESTESYGGTWKYRDEDIEGVASVMSTTIINHSKELGSISDYPPPKEYPNYMPHKLLFEYWTNFAKENGCFKHIRYNHEVISVTQARDYDVSGEWVVDVRNKITGECSSDIYDCVFVCVGHSTHPKIPSLLGMEKFKGSILHTHSLKKVDEYKNHRVAVVGIGCSGLDASVETSAVAKQVYLSTRRGAWIFPRLGPYGIPFDYALLRRSMFMFLNILPTSISSSYIEKMILTSKFNHDLYGIKPKHRVLSQDPAVSDMFPYKLLTGSILMKGDIKYFTEKGIVFEGEDQETQLDSIIMATGYNWQFPFFKDDIVTKTEGRINLYKCVYPTQLKHPTLAIIGFVQPLGPGFPFGEMQCRWAVQLLLGNVKLPNEKTMVADITAHHNRMAKRYPKSDRLTIHVDYITYLDDIASQIGAKPNLFKMAIEDPRLFWELFNGPSLPFQYRLQGPHPWSKAREAILTSKDRMKAPFQKGKPFKHNQASKPNYFMFYMSVFVVIWTMTMIALGLH